MYEEKLKKTTQDIFQRTIPVCLIIFCFRWHHKIAN